ncbi:PREDICTED: chaperone protein dnaJ 8, chloroplastic-like isoform X2 [Lupinus angustifolius]|uniref:chaperone protein dnaJ 8, chloroplastic-like isoform X2 n=1 Tax=Lupinus angustifolius TaxID=3871 RepID=UPI00092F36F0|nr:PREDICTED: chaperone protein dnaJ 8, chloroplastic-like isoform X2 [Lupinus angustifolius]
MAGVAASGVVGGNGSSSSSSWMKLRGRREMSNKVNRVKISCSYSSSSSVMDPYKTLRLQSDASESEVRKAFRQLALQVVMANLRGESKEREVYEEAYDVGIDEPLRGMNDPDWDMWEEWMGWEGAGIRDYSSHINPYI